MNTQMNLNSDESLAWIASRRSIYPKMFISNELEKETVSQLLEAARWAPTHKLTEPWRFVVFMQSSKSELVEQQLNGYAESKELVKGKADKMQLNADQSGAVVAIVMKRDSQERIPVFEEMCAVACAVQNVSLHAQSLGLGGYWSTGAGTNSDHIRSFLGLERDDVHLGWYYVGQVDGVNREAPRRKEIEEIVGFR